MEVAGRTQALIYRIDAAGCLTYVNPVWSEFARDNQGEAALPEHVLGRRLMDSIADTTVRELYKSMIKRARAGTPVRFRYRCDAPDKRRTFAMDIHLLPGGEVEFTSTLLQEEARPPVALLEVGHKRNERMLVVCSWCQKVCVPEKNWVPVEEAVGALRLMEAERLPSITHGICASCQTTMMASIGLALAE